MMIRKEGCMKINQAGLLKFSHLPDMMTDRLRLVELSGSDERKEISLQPRLVFPVEFCERLLLSRRRVWIQLSHVTDLVAGAEADATPTQRVQSVLPSLGLVREELDLNQR